MNDIAVESAVDAKLAELDRRVGALETKVAALPDAQKIEEHVTERLKSKQAPPVDPTQAPSFKDIEIPIPSVQSVVKTAKATWLMFEIFGELRMLFWTLFDRRYHMAWFTRVVTIVLLVAILTSHWWAPFAVYDNFFSNLWDKLIDLFLGLILFVVLSFETRRYKEWRKLR